MNNELVRVENNNILVEEKVIKEINKFQKTKLKMDIMQEQLKESLKEALELIGENKYVSPDGTLVVNYFPEKTSKRLDTTKLKNEKPEVYDEFLKDVTTKSYVKLTVK